MENKTQTTGKAVKESPIIFSPDMVQAVLAGTKKMTRRIVKPMRRVAADVQAHPELDKMFKDYAEFFPNPYGNARDLLWVRENWMPEGFLDPEETEFMISYPATGGTMTGHLNEVKNKKYGEMIAKDGVSKIKPSIHMWVEFSRIWLQVKSIRIERLTNISPEDAVLEGIEYSGNTMIDGISTRTYKNYVDPNIKYCDPITSFRSLWESINGKDAWDANPWVWVIEFQIASCGGRRSVSKSVLEGLI